MNRCHTTSVHCEGNSGFALVTALSLMAFLLMLLLALAAMLEVEGRRANAEMEIVEARANALFGMRVALANLQKAAGPDQRVTARADILTTDAANIAVGKRYWTGVWDTTAEIVEDPGGGPPAPGTEAVWLASGVELEETPLDAFGGGARQVELVGTGSATDRVLANIVQLSDAEDRSEGAYAWWVGDEGIKAKLNIAVSDVEEVEGAGANSYLSITSRRFGIENVEDFEDMEELFSGRSERSGSLSRISSTRQLDLLTEEEEEEEGTSMIERARNRYFDLTTATYGVIANTRDGGLRRDLTARLASDGDLDYPIWEDEYQGEPIFGPNWSLLREYADLVEQTQSVGAGENYPTLKIQTSGGIGTSYMSQQRYPNRPGLHPLPLYMGCTFGIFAVETDPAEPGWKSYRLRLAVKPVVALWNPYDVALDAPDGYTVYFFCRNGGGWQEAPKIFIRNSTTDTFSLDRHGNYQFPGRHLPLFLMDPDYPALDRPELNPPYAEEFYPRFSIGATRLLPGEIAVFSLPPNTQEPYQRRDAEEFGYTSSSEQLHGVDPAYAKGGPELVKGHNVESYVWYNLPSFPTGSSGSSGGDPPSWNGTYADLGRVDFWPVERDEDGNVVATSRDVRTRKSFKHDDVDVETVEDEEGNEQPADGDVYPDKEERTLGLYPVSLGFSMSGGNQFGVEFNAGQLFFAGGNTQAESNRNRSTRLNQLGLQYTWSRFRYEPGISWTYGSDSTEDPWREFERKFVGTTPINFGTWAIVMTNPVLEDIDYNNYLQFNKFLAHHNLRATVHHNFLDADFSYGRTMHGPLYQSISEGGEGVAPLFGEAFLLPEDASREVSTDSGQVRIGPILYHIPRHGLISMGQLAHVDMARNVWMPGYVFGNSIASPWISSDRTAEIVNPPNAGLRAAFPDQSWHANNALWDPWFLSTRPDPAADPVNPRLVEFRNSSASAEIDAELQAATDLMIDGPFNLNSTSVEAWKAVLGSLNQSSFEFSDSAASGANGDEQTGYEQTLTNPFLRFSLLPKFGGEVNDGDFEYESWRSIPELTNEQLEIVSRRIVYELRSRGRPFYSLADFINREPDRANTTGRSDRDPRLYGILQRVFDASYGGDSGSPDRLDGIELEPDSLNPDGHGADQLAAYSVEDYENIKFEDAYFGLSSTGVPGYLLQSDLLQVLAPIISVRSDTFVIRSYGEVPSDAGGDGPRAQVWCEAVVQRVPDYVDSANSPAEQPVPGSINARFGRQFRMISFRWLSPEEI